MRRMLTVFGIGLLAFWSGSSLAQPPVNLGTASHFAVLAGTEVTNLGYTLINGDLGLHPGTLVSGFPPGEVNGTQYVADAVALQAQNDLITAYDDAAGRTPFTTVPTELGETTLVAGVYTSGSGTFEITGTLTLDGQNDSNGVFVFQMTTSLNTATSSQVELIGGAQSCNIFWQVGSLATLGTYSSFAGNILALTSINVATDVLVDGRTLARNGQVTFEADTITASICGGDTNGVCIPDVLVTLVPNNPNFPGPQDVHACAQLSATVNTQVVVPVLGAQNVPTVTIASGCSDCGDPWCEPLSNWVLGDWTFVANPPQYVANLTADAGAAGCCVCLHLDYVLLVELSSFDAIARDGEVELRWTTASETNNDHFEILRDDATVVHVEATNNPTGSSYQWTDRNLTNGITYTYTLVSVDLSGAREELATESATPGASQAVITEYALHQNYPNPFNPETNIVFDLVDEGFVSLRVFNLMGQEVAIVVNASLEAGRHIMTFDGSGLVSGIYLARLDAGEFSQTKKLMLLK